ncbi:MAG: gamma-glutamyl-phosphate reductase, partial [Sphingomonas sp.]
MADAENPTEMIAEMGRRARAAALVLAAMPSERKAAALASAAESIRSASSE